MGVRRFAMGVPPPIPAEGFAGRVALSGWLVPTGARAYEPAVLRLGGVVAARIEARVEGARIAGLEGAAADVAAVRRHHDAVGARLGIDPDAVHSFHAGLHPGCGFAGRAEDDPDLWTNTVFPHPRMLHFHACGAHAPGEVCWTVMDPTIRLDGAALWGRGRLRPERSPPTRAALDAHPALRRLFAARPAAIGE